MATEREVEAAAKAMYACAREHNPGWCAWEHMPFDSPNSAHHTWLRLARAALEAASRVRADRVADVPGCSLGVDSDCPARTKLQDRVADLEAELDHFKALGEHDVALIEAQVETLAVLRAERDEWKQCAEVEAGVRREFKKIAEKAEAALDSARRANAQLNDAVKAHEGSLQTERDAIETRTIERAVKVIKECREGDAETCLYLIDAIRALARTPAGSGSGPPSPPIVS